MTPLDPFSLRINQQIEDERDRLRIENAELEEDNARLLVCAREVARFNSSLLDQIDQLRAELHRQEAA